MLFAIPRFSKLVLTVDVFEIPRLAGAVDFDQDFEFFSPFACFDV